MRNMVDLDAYQVTLWASEVLNRPLGWLLPATGIISKGIGIATRRLDHLAISLALGLSIRR